MGSGGMLTSAAGYARSAKKRLGDYGQWQQHQMMRPVRLMPVSYRGCVIAVVAKHPGPPRSWTNAGRDDWDQPHERPVAACMLTPAQAADGPFAHAHIGPDMTPASKVTDATVRIRSLRSLFFS